MMVDPNNHDNGIYLLLHETHCQQIITSDGCCFMNDHHSLLHGHHETVCYTELNYTTVNHSRSLQLEYDSISDNASNDHRPFSTHDKSTSIAQDLFTPHTSDDINCPMSQDMMSTADLSFSYIQEEMVEPLSNEVSVSNSTLVEATNVPITNEAAIVCE